MHSVRLSSYGCMLVRTCRAQKEAFEWHVARTISSVAILEYSSNFPVDIYNSIEAKLKEV